MINLYPDEKVNATIRRHWFIIFSQILIVIVMALLPLIVFISFQDFLKSVVTNDLFIFIYTLWLLFVWAYLSIMALDYYLDVWIVTNKRVFDVEQKGLFNREVSEFPLDRIQDITVKVEGLIPTLLDFGDIHVMTASETKELIFRQIPEPEKAKTFIWEQYHKSKITGANGNS